MTDARQLYQVVAPKLKRLFLPKVADPVDVDELVQDTFLHVLDALPLYRHESNMWTFVSSIARHELADYWRKRYAKRLLKIVPLLDHLPSKTYTSGETSAKIHQAMETAYALIKPIQARILRLKYEEELSVKEIADVLGWTTKVVETQLYRARKSFRLAYVEPELYG